MSSTLKGAFIALCFSFQTQQAAAQSVTIAAPESVSEVLVPATLEAFARDRKLSIRREIMGEGAFAMVLTDANGGNTARFDFRSANAEQAVSGYKAGAADILILERTLRPKEAETLEGAIGFTLGRDALVPVVAKGNPVKSISLNDLAKVLSGDVRNWSNLGGPDAPIAVHVFGTGSDLDGLLEQILQERSISPDAQTHVSAALLSDYVAADPFALGVTLFSELGNAQSLALSGSCGLSVSAGRFSLKTDDFPLTNPLLAYIRPEKASGTVRDFISFLQEPGAQGAVRQAGFIDSLSESVGLSDQGERLINAIRIAGVSSPAGELRRLVEVLENHKRLSVTFRFQPKSSDLDSGSLQAVSALGQALVSGAFDGSDIVFVGFSDGVGSSDQNLRVGRSRAQAVQEAVRAAAEGLDEGKVTLSTEAFGEAMPIACDDTDWGRDANRRVEVWTK